MRAMTVTSTLLRLSLMPALQHKEDKGQGGSGDGEVN